MKNDTMLEIKNLNISVKTSRGRIGIIRGVNLELKKAKTLAIVGESGSGKSVTVKSLMSLLPQGARIDSGELLLKDRDPSNPPIDLAKLSHKEMIEKINGQRIAMVFQDPLTILNPTMTIGNQIMEGMILHRGLS